MFVHFELIPDHLPERLKEVIAQFPPGSLQFEIGIQSFNPAVQARVSRRQNDAAAEANLRWLRAHSRAHLHVDLIAGLPGEDMTSFAAGFDRLVALAPHEVQFGILKRLRGAPIARHTLEFGLRFNPDPPYNILATDAVDFATLQRLSRFSRYWDIVANSGRHPRGLALLLGSSPFARFLNFSDWLYARISQTHAIAHERLVLLLREHLHALSDHPPEQIDRALVEDYRAAGGRSRFDFEPADSAAPLPRSRGSQSAGATPKRQARHLQAGATGS